MRAAGLAPLLQAFMCLEGLHAGSDLGQRSLKRVLGLSLCEVCTQLSALLFCTPETNKKNLSV